MSKLKYSNIIKNNNTKILMLPHIQYLLIREPPTDLAKARLLKIQATRFVIIDGIFYKQAFSMPLLRCLSPWEAQQALNEVHEEDCGEHLGGRALATKIMRA